MEAVSVVNGQLSLVSLPEYGDVGCDGFDYLSHHKYGLLSLDPTHARSIRWMDGESYHVPREVSFFVLLLIFDSIPDLSARPLIPS